jgi:mannose-6-phosphate isomerase-like protein (cupin superfamily)
MWLAQGHYVGSTVLTSADERTTYLLVRRTTSSQPEWHARWDDIVVVRSGSGVIVFGDSLVGSTLRAPGERRGGHFTKNYQIVVRGGDLVRIPAAVPHAFIVSGTEPLEYLVIKTRRQELPIRWARAEP